MKPYYITTPIYYVNDRPHIGHCYTTLVADATARFQRLAGRTVFFLTGTDEHADKVVTSALAHDMSPQQWSDQNAAAFQAAFQFMGMTNDDFVRTTQERHKTKVVEYIAALMKSGDIYAGTYEGWYDPSQEEYLTETVAKEAQYNSPVTGRPLIRRSEKCYFFKLSKYQDRLQKLLTENPRMVEPESRRNEVLGRLRDGLQDVPVSRPITDDPATQWGIRVPGDEHHRIYVWIDALFNYLSVVDTDERRADWPADVHYIAKDILWFHAVIWPALLMALKEADGKRFGFVGLPAMLYSHAYWVRDGRKMSKSLGNFVTIEVLQAYAAKYSLDAVRWYLLTQGPLGAQDADFSHAKFVEVYNAELANGIGNSTSRVGDMLAKYFDGRVPEVAREAGKVGPHGGYDFATLTREAVQAASKCMERCDLSGAFGKGVELVRAVDGYINATAPFKLAKLVEADPSKKGELGGILYRCAEALRVASILMSPAMPGKMASLWETWGIPGGGVNASGAPLEKVTEFAGAHGLNASVVVAKGDALFMRADVAEAAPA